MKNESLIRAFLAIEPPEEIQRALSIFEEQLKKTLKYSITWVRKENIHLTLKFFGTVHRDTLKSLSTSIRTVCTASPTFIISVEGLGAFPDLKRPRVLWVGTSGDVDTLKNLQSKLEHVFQSLGFKNEERDFRGHLTLGRLKKPQPIPELMELVKTQKHARFGEFKVDKLILFQSNLTPSGAVYTKLDSFPFGG
ncbi:MAG: RNA 2',3'-cyclic phosphodiesterase [Syntrophales bacterium]|nr:RNA 2',3'-cyclic phosphodiesterase [Syntrophales bacterium]